MYGKEKGRRWRGRVRRQVLGILQKVINRTADLHNKVCSWVVNSYKVMLLPLLESKRMVSTGKLSSNIRRNMMTWHHNAFQRKLVALAQKHTDVKIRLYNEAFTTRQCGGCGVVNRDTTLGGRTFWCTLCSSRDGHAARNTKMLLIKPIPHLIYPQPLHPPLEHGPFSFVRYLHEAANILYLRHETE